MSCGISHPPARTSFTAAGFPNHGPIATYSRRCVTSSTPMPHLQSAKRNPSGLVVLGPIIRAEVGHTVTVHFRNAAFKAGGSYGMHPHGFRYTKDNEGAHYIPAGAGAEVPVCGRFDYVWVADQDSGPGPGDPSSLVW